jgi:hypothetical protein
MDFIYRLLRLISELINVLFLHDSKFPVTADEVLLSQTGESSGYLSAYKPGVGMPSAPSLSNVVSFWLVPSGDQGYRVV